jgi:DNA-binding XRE family transcriptional regulator
MPINKKDAKEFAKILFLDTNSSLTQKEIADRVGVRPNTVGDWIKKEGWAKLKRSLLTTRQQMIGDLYEQLERLNTEIKTRAIIYDVPEKLLKPFVVKDKNGNEKIETPAVDQTMFPVKIGNYASSKEANQIGVLTNAIKKLETETSIAETVEVSRDFLEWIKPQDFEYYKKLVPFFDEFINSKL